MNNKYFVYALCVTIAVTFCSWLNMFGEAGRSGGSSWSSGTRGGYGGGSGYSGGGGGHK
jgi:hypothetical protein